MSRAQRILRRAEASFVGTPAATVLAAVPPAAVGGAGVLLVFAAAAYAFSRSEKGGADVFLSDLIGGAASSIVVFAGTAGIYLVLRNWRAKRRILRSLMATSVDPGPRPAVLGQLASHLTSGAEHHAVVTVDAGAPREAAKIWIARAVVERNGIPIAITAAVSESEVEARARERFLALAERAGERGDFLMKLWSRQWRARKIVVIATALDEGVVPGEQGAVETVAAALGRWEGVHVPTVALVGEGTFPPDLVPTAALAPVLVRTPLPEVDDDLPPMPDALDAGRAEAQALHVIGRLLHLRNESLWTWGDLAQAPDAELASAGMASLVARGIVGDRGDGRYAFANLRVLALVRGRAAGIGPEALWGVVLDVNRSPVALDSVAIASREAPESLAASQSPIDAVLGSAGIRAHAVRHLPVLTSVVQGLVESSHCSTAVLCDNLVRIVDDSWRPTVGEHPDAASREAFVRVLPVGDSPELVGWAWRQLRDAASPGTRLEYSVRRALVERLAGSAPRTADALDALWQVDLASLTCAAIVDGRRGTASWASTATACHLAWLAPSVLVQLPVGAQASGIAATMRALGDLARQVAREGAAHTEGSLAFLQAWTEGLAFARIRCWRSEREAGAESIDPLVGALDALHEPWAARFALVMAASVAGRPPAEGGLGHPVTVAWLAAFAAASDEERRALVWDDDFAELRRAGAGLAPTAQWCLAAKAILFSAAEVARARGRQEESDGLMSGARTVPAWLADTATTRAGRGLDEAEIAVLMAQPNRRITPTFAAVTLLSPRPRARGDAGRFWRSIEGILSRMADVDVVAKGR